MVDTPFTSNIGRDTAENTYFEWMTDSLASPDTANAAVEGADAGTMDFTPTVRVGQYTQISTKVISVSGTSNAVNTAGMRTVKAYETAKKAKELKRDVEAILLSNQAGNAGSTSWTSLQHPYGVGRVRARPTCTTWSRIHGRPCEQEGRRTQSRRSSGERTSWACRLRPRPSVWTPARWRRRRSHDAISRRS